jgi:hypothetical protein
MRRIHPLILLFVASNVLLFQNCAPIPMTTTKIYQNDQSSSGDPGAQSLGTKMLSYETDSGTTPAGVDPVDKRLTWYTNGQVIETVIRHAASGDTQTDTTVAVVSVDTVTLRGRITSLPAAVNFTMVPGSSVACGSGDKRYVAYRRDGTSVVMYEERDCSGAFTSDAYDQVLFDKVMAIRNIVQ